MTETELRQKAADTAIGWLGTVEGSAGHARLLEIYNSQDPLPRGTRMRSDWPWCAAFVSTVSLQLGLRDIMPTEMSCHQMILLYKQLGRWVENDAYVPSPGDVILYDWDDGKNYASTDNTGTPDHVGIVTACDGKTISVIEGNVNSKVAMRTLAVNGRYIRGFGIPDYASKATEEEPADKTDDLARKIATEINDSGLDAAAVLTKVTALLGIPDKAETPAESEKTSPTAVEIDALARAVIAGQYGNGAARRAMLGDNYDAVQKRVNEILRG